MTKESFTDEKLFGIVVITWQELVAYNASRMRWVLCHISDDLKNICQRNLVWCSFKLKTYDYLGDNVCTYLLRLRSLLLFLSSTVIVCRPKTMWSILIYAYMYSTIRYYIYINYRNIWLFGLFGLNQ